MAKRWKGTICPCCDGIAKVYKRSFTKTLARILRVMHFWDIKSPGSWHHVKNEWPGPRPMFNPEYARMVDLGLIEENREGREDGNPNNGFHRITQKGKDFCNGKVTIPKYVYCYKGKVIDESNARITFADAWGTPFNYQEIFN